VTVNHLVVGSIPTRAAIRRRVRGTLCSWPLAESAANGSEPVEGLLKVYQEFNGMIHSI
jgi:hypothetical protein